MTDVEHRITALKGLIQQHLQATGVTDKISRALKEESKDRVIQTISRENVVDRVVSELKNISLESAEPAPAPDNTLLNNSLPPDLGGKRFLQVSIGQGRAFLDDLEHNDGTSVQIQALFLGKRCISKSVPASCEPCFDETFYFCLDPVDKKGTLLTCHSKLHITITRTEHNGNRHLLGCCLVEWRGVLDRTDSVLIHQELSGTKSDCGVSVGLLPIRLKVLPVPDKRLISSDLFKSQLKLESDRNTERDRLFLMYTKQWWNEYLALRDTHSQRLVKIFTEEEHGKTVMVCMMITPIRSVLIETPRYAARYVSLIPCNQRSVPGACGATEQWLSLNTFIAARNGDLENHCVLLCSLLLGFGLDSYVCIGSRARGTAHVWVMTLSDHSPTFWDALTGQRYVDGDTVPYKTVDCVFNDTSFYGNIQPSNSLSKARYDLRDPVLWKGISEEAIQSMRDSVDQYTTITLNPSVIDPYQTAANLEHQLRRLVRDERENHDLSTHWNEQLAHLLLPALSAYELERATGVTISNDDFQHAVRHAVPTGFTFKGYPTQFNHLNIRQIFRHCMKSEVCSDLVLSHGDSLQLAVKIRVYSYPEDVVALWVMFAAQYRAIL